MKFEPALQEAQFLRRYKRFFADVALPDGSELTIHCANTGSMKHCLEEGMPCWFSRSANPKRKLPGTLEIVTNRDGLLAGVNTASANTLVAEAIESGGIPDLGGFVTLRREVRYGRENSRIDLLLEGNERRCYVEVKNVSLSIGAGKARFPDAVSSRGSKHLRELMAMVAEGHRAVLFFCAQLEGVDEVGPADDIDRVYGETLREAIAAGVEVMAYGCRLSAHEITIDRKLQFVC